MRRNFTTHQGHTATLETIGSWGVYWVTPGMGISRPISRVFAESQLNLCLQFYSYSSPQPRLFLFSTFHVSRFTCHHSFFFPILVPLYLACLAFPFPFVVLLSSNFLSPRTTAQRFRARPEIHTTRTMSKQAPSFGDIPSKDFCAQAGYILLRY